MALPQTITGAAWPTSGNVTSGNSGFYNIAATAGKLTYKAFGTAGAVDAKPSGCNSASYIEYDTRGVATTAGFYVSDWTDVNTAITTGSKLYEMEFFFQIGKAGNFVANTTPADATGLYFCQIGNIYAGFRLFVQNSNTYGEGFIYNLVASGLGGTPVAKGFSSCESGNSTYYPAIKFDTWYRGKIRFKGGATGYYQFWINGRLVGEGTGDMSALANLQFTFALPGAASTWPQGMVLRYTGPITASNGAISSTIYNESDSLDQHCTKHLPIRFQGCDGENRWTVTTSGSITSTLANWATSGISPARYRKSFTGTQGASETWNSEKLYDNSLDLSPFNEEGWCSLRLLDFQMTGSVTRSTLGIQIYNSDNSAVDIDLTVDASGNLINTVTGAVLFSSVAISNNYGLLIHMSRFGEVYLTLMDQSNTTLASTAIRSAYYGRVNTYGSSLAISGSGIGKLKLVLTLGNNGTPLLDGAMLLKWATLPMVDSYVHAVANAVTPNMTCKNNVYLFRDAEEVFSIPGGFSPRVYGTSLDCVTGGIIARSGQTLSSFFTNLSTAFENSRGIRVMQLGGLVNDNANMTLLNYETYVTNTVNFAESLIANGNHFWFAAFPTTPGNPFPATFTSAFPLYNAAVIEQLNVLGDKVAYSDVSGVSTSFDGIGVHPIAASCLTLYRAVGTTRTAAELLLTDSFSGSAGIDLDKHVADQGASWIPNAATPNGRIQLVGEGFISNTVVGTSLYTLKTTPTSVDYSVGIDVVYKQGSTLFMLGLRCAADAYTGYFAGYSGGAWRILRVADGDETELATVNTTLENYGTYSLEFTAATSGSDTVLTLSVDGTEVLEVTDLSASDIDTAGYPGLRLHSSGSDPANPKLSNFFVTKASTTAPRFSADTGNEGYDYIVAFDGDGITYGLGTEHPGDIAKSTYPGKLIELLEIQDPSNWLAVVNATEDILGTDRTYSDLKAYASSWEGNYVGKGPIGYLLPLAGNIDIRDGDLSGGIVSGILNELSTYYDERKVAGWNGVGVGTILPCSGSAYHSAFNSIRAEINKELRTNTSLYGDFLVDFAADPFIGYDGASDDTTYYSTDKINPNSAGCKVMADIALRALNAYIASQEVADAGGTLTTKAAIMEFIRAFNWGKTFPLIDGLKQVSCEYRSGRDVLVLKYKEADTDAATVLADLVTEAASIVPDAVLTTNEVVCEPVTTKSRQAYPGSVKISRS